MSLIAFYYRDMTGGIIHTSLLLAIHMRIWSVCFQLNSIHWSSDVIRKTYGDR